MDLGWEKWKDAGLMSLAGEGFIKWIDLRLKKGNTA